MCSGNSVQPAVVRQERMFFHKTPTKAKRKNGLNRVVIHAMNQVAEQIMPNKTPKSRREIVSSALQNEKETESNKIGE